MRLWLANPALTFCSLAKSLRLAQISSIAVEVRASGLYAFKAHGIDAERIFTNFPLRNGGLHAQHSEREQ